MDYDQRINKLENGSDTAIWAAKQIKKKDIEISNYEEVIELLKDRNQQLIDDQERLVMRDPPKLGVVTLCRLMDDCLPAQIENAQDMQKLIDKLWPALVCAFEVGA